MAGIFGSKTLFSAVTGVVQLEGKPCVGAQIEQSVSDGGGERIETEKVTGSDGKFSFPEITKSKGLFSFLPGEFVASQELIIRFEGREYQGWISTKRSMEANSETGGRPFELICNLNEDPDYHDKSFGVCQLVDS